MSFSSELKIELTQVKTADRDERCALLCALTHTSAYMKLGRGGLSVEYITELRQTAELTSKLVAELYPRLEISSSMKEQEGLKSKNYVVEVRGEGCKKLLVDFGCLPEDEEFEQGSIPFRFAESERLEKAFLRGAFLGAGSMSDPGKGYHLEIVCRHERFAQSICAMLTGFGINAKTSVRKNSFIVYMKDGESISDMLCLAGAVDKMLGFENIRVMRFMANDVNRRSNFDMANIEKTARASAQQLIDITLIADSRGLDSLPQALRQTAEARLNNPEATLGELAQELDIGKSGANHRLAKLAAIADDIRLHGSGRAIKEKEL